MNDMDGQTMGVAVQSVAEHLYDILKLVVGIGTALGVIYGWIVKPIRRMQAEQAETNKRVAAELTQIKTRLDSVQEDVADTLGDRLAQAYRHFMKQGWCSHEEKQFFVRVHQQYSSRGHNHLADTYESDLLRLPEEPPEVMEHGMA